MSKKTYHKEKSAAAFSWGAIHKGGAIQKRGAISGAIQSPKKFWEDRVKTVSESSSTSSDPDCVVKVSARQRKLLSSAQELSSRGDSGRLSSSFGHNVGDRDWLRSARQKELIRTGSGSNLKELLNEHSKSALKEWPSTASQRLHCDLASPKATSDWSGSAGSREYKQNGQHRDSAGSLGRSGSGADLLVEAVRFGRFRHIKLLLDGGTDPNSLDHEGVSPLVAAIADVKDAKTQKRAIHMLLEAGADPNVGDGDGTTPLMHAAIANSHDAAVILLQNRKTDPSIKNDAGFSALMYAASNGYSNVVLLILAAFKKIHHVTHLGEKNGNGLTAIDLAERNGHYDISALLRVDLIPFAASRRGPKICFAPGAHQLSRSPSPSDDSLVLSEESDCSDFNPLNDRTFRPPTPVSDFEGFASLSLVSKKLELLENRSNSDEACSSLGSGNEADTESLMDEDRVPLNEEEFEAFAKMSSTSLGNLHQMSSPAMGTSRSISSSVVGSTYSMSSLAMESHPSSITTPDSVISSTLIKIPKQTMKIIVDHDSTEKLKDIVPGTFHRGAELQNTTSQVHSLNPLKKVGLPTQSSLTIGGEQMPRIELAASVRSLNKSIKSLIQEDQEIKPSLRPPTPARPSLPVLPLRQDSDSDSPLSTSSNEIVGRSRRLTLGGYPRSNSESQSLLTSPQKASQNEDETPHDILEASTKSEGWDAVWGPRGRALLSNSDGHVVPLPPIGQSRHSINEKKRNLNGKQVETSVLSVAKKTLERLDNVLGADDASKRKSKSLSRLQHLNLSS